MASSPRSPEPKGTAPMFGENSWQRPAGGAAATLPKPARREWPPAVTRASFRDFLGEKRLTEWGAICTGAGLDFAALLETAGKAANGPAHIAPTSRHYDARGHLRCLISDGVRAYLDKAGTPHAPRPMLY